jgi:hypothetical protein
MRFELLLRRFLVLVLIWAVFNGAWISAWMVADPIKHGRNFQRETNTFNTWWTYVWRVPQSHYKTQPPERTGWQLLADYGFGELRLTARFMHESDFKDFDWTNVTKQPVFNASESFNIGAWTQQRREGNGIWIAISVL